MGRSGDLVVSCAKVVDRAATLDGYVKRTLREKEWIDCVKKSGLIRVSNLYL